MTEESDKIVRNPDTLLIKLTAEENQYRHKYLPDPKKLTNEKLVCTVCSKSLVADVHKGEELFVHRFLKVLICEACYNFYGDGCFSCDEDGDDKYCRWCGQGGTLFLCSTCTCAFCQKCVKQNLKSSVIAELDKDDWKCYICNPRPLFGTRTICWGAQELNKIGKEKEIERLIKQKEKQDKINENRKKENERKSRKDLESGESLKTKRKKASDDDSTSPEVLPSKTSRRDRRSVNGSVGKKRSRRNSSSSDDRDKKRNSRTSKNKSYVESSSEDDSDFKHKTRHIKKKKKRRESSSELSESTRKSKSSKVPKKNVATSDDDSNYEKRTSKTRLSNKREKNFSDNLSDDKLFKKKKKVTDTEDSSDVESNKKLKKVKGKGKVVNSEKEDSDCESNKRGHTKLSLKKAKSTKSDCEQEKFKERKTNLEKVEETKSCLKNVATLSPEDLIVKKRIKLAILWLSSTVKDIAELGALISVRAKKFGMKKVNTENLKTYEDVINTVTKLKQLMSGVHSNYEHIEKNLDAQLKPWKVVIGKDYIGCEIPKQEEKIANDNSETNKNVVPESNEMVSSSGDINSNDKVPVHKTETEDKRQPQKNDGDFELSWVGESDESDNKGKNDTQDLISKANETLERMEELETTNKCNKESSELELKNLKEKVTNESSNTSVCKISTDEPKESSKVSVSDSGEDGSLKPLSTEKEMIINHSTPKKSLKEGASETNEKSIETVIENSESESNADVSPQKNNKEDTGKKSKEKTRKETEKKKETLIERSESTALEKKEEDTKENCKSSRKLKSKKKETPKKKEINCSGNKDAKQNKDRTSKDCLKHSVNSEEFAEKDGKSKEENSETDDELSQKTKTGKQTTPNNINEKRTLSSSDESTTFKMFGEQLKNKWEGKLKTGEKTSKSSPALENKEEGTKEKFKSSRKLESKKQITPKKREINCSRKNLNEEAKQNRDQKSTNLLEDSVNSEELSDKGGQSKEEQSETDDKNEEDKLSQKTRRVTKNKQSNSKERDESLEEPSEKDQKKQSLHNKKEKNSEIRDNTKSSTENGKKDGASKERKAKSVSSKISSEKNDRIEEEQSQKSKERDVKEESKTDECIVNKDKEQNVVPVEIKKEKCLDKPTKTKFIDLGSSSEDEDISFVKIKSSSDDTKDEILESKEKEKTLKPRSVHNQRRPNKSHLLDSSEFEDVSENEEKKEIFQIESSDEDIKKKNKKGKKDDTVTFSSTESSDSDIFVPKKKQKGKKQHSSESDASEKSEDKKMKKRKLVRCADSSDESGGSGKKDVGKKSTQGESPGKGGRKNIKKIKKGDDLADATKEAAEEEKERRRRIEDRQKLYNKVFEIKETATIDNLVLDFDLENKKELISVNKDLVAKMKPHQAKGVKFMWDSCFESLSELKKSKGSGCILAHCMGLGKTFQVVSLLHTLLLHKETKVRTVMVVCPLSTVLNWYNEFDKWLKDVEGGDSIDVYHLTSFKQNPDRARALRNWQDTGGVLIIGYEMFRNLSCEGAKKFRPKMRKDFQETLVDPGADIIVCDEGHMLKNEATALSKAMTRVRTLRRIVLTGTPMQNNLKEYHCMVQFVKPNLLGSRKEFLNRFVNPITNGQFVDSTDRDVKIMKRRAHVLHKMLEGLVQRFDYNVLTPFLPPKQEYVISVSLSELQIKLYQHYLESYSQQSANNKAGSRLFQDWQALGRIWTHPRVIKMSSDRESMRKLMEETDEEGSLKDFIDDDDDDEEEEEKSTSNSSDEDSDSDQSIKSKKNVTTRVNRSSRTTRSSNRIKDQLLESSDEEIKIDVPEGTVETENKGAWWSGMIDHEHLDDINHSGKLCLLFAILKECEAIEDKVLVFSQSLFSLDLIEYFLDKIDAATQEDKLEERLGNHQGTWSKGLDYFRLDGSTSSENRNIWCNAFNREDNPRARLFLISTRAGGLGINLTAANRVIIFDASWNPSHDVQSIFRVYRFGQKKPCYVYRFVAYGTMEEKVYERQVAKQSMSNRVVDEQQVHRHFSSNDLNELYSFTPPSKMEDRPLPALPKDVLLAEILTQFKNWIEKYHEHDSLLENVEAEELNEEERKLAWEDFENDKKRSLMPTNTGPVLNNALSAQIEILRLQLKAQYPDKTDTELQPLLVNQVTVLMKQQQQQQQQQLWQEQQRRMAAQIQARGNLGNSLNPPAFSSANLTPEQMFNLQVLQMQQQQHYANMARAKLQMTQTHQRVPQSIFVNQGTPLPGQSQLSHLLTSQLNNTGKNVQMPRVNYNASAALNLENMRQNYLAARQKPNTVSITEIPNDPKPSSS